jgi:hypothetical protein
MSVTDAEDFFGAGETRTPAAHKTLHGLADAGPGYLSLRGEPGRREDAYQRGLEILLRKAPTRREEELMPWPKTVPIRLPPP